MPYILDIALVITFSPVIALICTLSYFLMDVVFRQHKV